MQKIYLDYNATSPLHDNVRTNYIEALDNFGNPSSVHFAGREAQKILEETREKIADYCGVASRNVIFTGSATEANHLILRGTHYDALIIPEDEHDSILKASKQSNKKIFPLRLTDDGDIDAQSFELVFSECEVLGLKPLLSIMKVNNETGRIKDFSYYASRVRSLGGIVHSDCVQALGKIEFSSWSWQCDAMTLGFHKVGGAKGIGCLIIKDNIILDPLLSGGGQELNRRAGTHNIPAIYSVSALIDLLPWHLEQAKTYKDWQDYLSDNLKNCSNVILPLTHNIVSNVLYIINEKFDAQTQVIMADLNGFAISSGSACSSGKVKSSHVLKSYGYDDKKAGCGIRVSWGFQTKFSDIEQFLEFYLRVCS